MKEPKYFVKKMNPQNQNQNQNQANNQNQTKSSGSNTTLIVTVIILVGIILLAILGVGGYFAWKYFSKKSALKTENQPAVATQAPSAALPQSQSGASSTSGSGNYSSKTKTLENLFKYPNASSSKTQYDTDYNAKIFLDMSTYDNLDTVYNFYETLASVNNWTLGSQGYSTGGSGAWINVEEKDFRAEVNMSYGGGITAITANVYFEDDTITFSQIKPTVTQVPSGNDSSFDPGSYDYSWRSEYVIFDSDTRLISESELYNLTPWQLKVARNEIYARHGRKFVHKDMSCYFSKQSWYYINSNFSESDLSSIENKNIATILHYEEEIRSPLLRKDSGCHD